MNIKPLVATLLVVFGVSLYGVDILWSLVSTAQATGNIETPPQTTAKTSSPTSPDSSAGIMDPTATASEACLTDPISVAVPETREGDKAKSVGKGFLSSVLSGATGGAISSRGGKRTRLERRPRYPKSRLDIENSKLELEFQGASDDGLVKMSVRVKKDPEKGGPHLVVLQDINCRVLMPTKVSVFELWGSGGLKFSWSSSTYQGGQQIGSDSGGWDTSWAKLRERYPDTSEIPGIWQSYGEKPFKGIRGVTVEFQPPPGETFNLQGWHLVTHITRPGPSNTSLTTEPVLTALGEGKKETYTFSQVNHVAWQPPLTQASVLVANDLFESDATERLVCKDDCRKILEEINQLACLKEDCTDKKNAVDAALQALADAQQAHQDALDDVEHAKSDIRNAQHALDKARAEQDQADRKLAIESAKQKRLQASLARGGHGLGPQQIQHAIEYSKGVVSGLEERSARSKAAVEATQNNLNAAIAALASGTAAVSVSKRDIEARQQALDAAKHALSDCMQREWKRCRTITDLWQEYQECKHRCREQDDTRSELDWTGEYLGEGQREIAGAAKDYKASAQQLKDLGAALAELGGTLPAGAQEASAEATAGKRQAEQHARNAQKKREDAEHQYKKGELEAAEQAAVEARDLQDKAEQAMEDAVDEMEYAAEVAGREYQKELNKKLERDNQERMAAAQQVALKKQVCLRYLAEYFDQQSGNSSFLQELGGFVSGDAKEAIDQASNLPANPEQLKEFLGKVEEQRQKLEKLLSILNGIGDNASLEARNAAFSTALGIAGEIAGRIPGLGEFFNFYSSAYNAAVGALYALEGRLIDLYKPMVDKYISGKSSNCCSYSSEELNEMSLSEVVDKAWEDFKGHNQAQLSRLSGESQRKLEDYFKSRLTIKWTKCCLQFTLDG